MSNYKKDRSYIKQRLEYVSPVDYISKLEEKTEYLEYLKNENEILNNIIDKQDRDITTLTKDKIKLKNIINELEKYLIKVIETSSKHEQITCKYVLKYLRELKEGEEWIKNL